MSHPQKILMSSCENDERSFVPRLRLWCVDCEEEAGVACESEAHDTRGLLSFRKRQAERHLQALEQLKESLSAVQGLQDQALEEIGRAGFETFEERVWECMKGLREGREPWDLLLQEAELLLEGGMGLDQDLKLVLPQQSMSVSTEDWRAEGLQLGEEPLLRLGLLLRRRKRGLLQERQPADGHPLEKRRRPPHLQQPSSSGNTRFEAAAKVCVDNLPDDVLARVFSFVNTSTLLREVRAVCWRWRNVALHPLAWRHRSAVSPYFCNTTENGIFLARVLLHAPCAASLSVWSKTLRVETALRQMALTTSCAAKSLTLHVERKDIPTVTKVLLNQAALGNLRNLNVTMEDFIDENTTYALFWIVSSLNLDSLEIQRSFTPVMSRNVVLDASKELPAQTSLKHLKLTGSFSNRLLELFLSTWGCSLESIDAQVIDEDADEWTTSWLLKLASCLNLQSATLPAVLEVASLADCNALTSLHLRIFREGKKGAAYKELTTVLGGFFESAVQLKTLEFSGSWYSMLNEVQCSMVVDLVCALASSGASVLEDFTLLSIASSAAPQLDGLESALPGLPQLRRLSLGTTPSCKLLSAITPSSTPRLSVLNVVTNCNETGGSPCFSRFMADLVRNNSNNLHVKIECEGVYRCPRYRGAFPRDLGLYGHSPDQKCVLHDSGVNWLWVGDL